MTRLIVSLLALSGLWTIAPGVADDELVARISAVAQEEVEAQGEVGMSVVVDVGGQVLLADGWGYADLHDREPASAESRYRVGALLETFLAVTALKLVEDGELELDAPVKNFVPALDFGDDVVSLRHVLAHTSGLPRIEDVAEVPGASSAVAGSAEFFEALAELALESTPGECFRYSDSDAVVLGAIVAKVLDESVADALGQAIFDPLDVRATVYCEEGPPLDEIAEEGNYVGGEFHAHGEHNAPPFDARLLCSTPLEVLAFQRALADRELFGDEAWRLWTGEQRLEDGTPFDYGLGANLAPLGDAECVSYGGALAGARLFVAYYPSIDMTIVVLARGEGIEVDLVQRRIARVVLDMPDPELRDASLSAEQRAIYLGGYYSGCTRIEVRDAADQLVLMLPDGEEFVLVHQGEHEFVAADDPEVVVTFELAEAVTGLWLVRRGAAIYAKRLE